MKDSDLGYLCSIIDSEGHIGISRKIGYKKYRYCLNFTISNTSMPLIEHIKQITKCGTIQCSRDVKPNKKLFCWAARFDESAIILPIVEPHLIIKRQQALLG